MYDRAPETLTEQRKKNIGNQAAHGAVVGAAYGTIFGGGLSGLKRGATSGAVLGGTHGAVRDWKPFG